jgi:hypothetical protein
VGFVSRDVGKNIDAHRNSDALDPIDSLLAWINLHLPLDNVTLFKDWERLWFARLRDRS